MVSTTTVFGSVVQSGINFACLAIVGLLGDLQKFTEKASCTLGQVEFGGVIGGPGTGNDSADRRHKPTASFEQVRSGSNPRRIPL